MRSTLQPVLGVQLFPHLMLFLAKSHKEPNTSKNRKDDPNTFQTLIECVNDLDLVSFSETANEGRGCMLIRLALGELRLSDLAWDGREKRCEADVEHRTRNSDAKQRSCTAKKSPRASSCASTAFRQLDLHCWQHSRDDNAETTSDHKLQDKPNFGRSRGSKENA